MKPLAILLALTLPALAAPFPVTDEDQNNIAAICLAAMKSPAVNDQVSMQIANWCVNWQARVKAAQAKPVETPAATEPKQ